MSNELNHGHFTVSEAFSENKLSNFFSKFKGEYGCMVLFEEGSSKNQLRYKLTIEHCGVVNNNQNIFKIDRDSKIYVNDKEPEDFIDKIAIQVSQVIYPLEIKTSYEGAFKDILNFDHILSRWKQQKKAIKETYKGDIVDKYIKLTDTTLSDVEFLKDKITKDWFINLYFSPIYKWYSDDLYVETDVKYPISGKAKPVNYKVRQEIEETEFNDLEINFKGTIQDERCALDLNQKLDYPYYRSKNSDERDLEGEANIKYLLNKKTGIIDGYEAIFNTLFEIPKKVTVKMFLQKAIKENIELKYTEENKPKKSFWSKFF